MNNKTLINLTPHDINIYVGNEIIQTIPTSKKQLRANETTNVVNTLNVNGYSINITVKNYSDCYILDADGNKTDLSSLNFDGSTLYITSSIALQYIPQNLRRYFIVPSDPVRDEKGNVIGCRSFSFILN